MPACWLAGFTQTGDQDGDLWVTDLGRRKQWQTNPRKAGHIRDFYRVEDPALDPVTVETALSKMEDALAPTLRAIDQERREPNGEEMGKLLQFAAVQWARVPSFRPTIFKVLESVTHERLAKALKNEDSWKKTLRRIGVAEDSPGAAYESMVEFQKSGSLSITVRTEWYLKQMFHAVDRILPTLYERMWRAAISPSGNFIACDNPVVLEGPKGQPVGFKNAELITYTLSRHVLLYSTALPMPQPMVTRRYIAGTNTLSLLRADQQVFSHVSDFCWLDSAHKMQTDWRKFKKETY